MTNWPPFRAGTPKLSAAGPDRNVTMPSLKVSCANAGAANARDSAATNAIVAIRERRLMTASRCFSRRFGAPVLFAPVLDRRHLLEGSLGRLFPPVYRGGSDLRLYVI